MEFLPFPLRILAVLYGEFTFHKTSYSLSVQLLSHVRPFAAPWTVACQDPLPMEFSRQEYWSGVPFPTPGDLPEPGIELTCLASSALAGWFFTTSATWPLL